MMMMMMMMIIIIIIIIIGSIQVIKVRLIYYGTNN